LANRGEKRASGVQFGGRPERGCKDPRCLSQRQKGGIFMFKITAVAAVLGLGVALSGSAVAQETLKIGVILPYSGPFADAANQLQAGIDLYLAEHGNEVAGRTIEIIKRDTGGPAPDVARRLAQ